MWGYSRRDLLEVLNSHASLIPLNCLFRLPSGWPPYSHHWKWHILESTSSHKGYPSSLWVSAHVDPSATHRLLLTFSSCLEQALPSVANAFSTPPFPGVSDRFRKPSRCILGECLLFCLFVSLLLEAGYSPLTLASDPTVLRTFALGVLSGHITPRSRLGSSLSKGIMAYPLLLAKGRLEGAAITNALDGLPTAWHYWSWLSSMHLQTFIGVPIRKCVFSNVQVFTVSQYFNRTTAAVILK